MTLPRQKTEKETLKLAETVLKKKHYAEIDDFRSSKKTKRMTKADTKIISAEQILKGARLARINRVRHDRLKRIMGGTSELKVPAKEASVLVVVRNARYEVPKDIRILLKTLQVDKRHHAAFVPNTEETMANLRLCQNYVFFGAPSADTLRHMLTSVGEARISPKHEITKLSSNLIIEDIFASQGALCIEDLVSIMLQRQEGWQEVLKMLCAMKLDRMKHADGVAATERFGWQDDFDNVLSQII